MLPIGGALVTKVAVPALDEFAKPIRPPSSPITVAPLATNIIPFPALALF